MPVRIPIKMNHTGEVAWIQVPALSTMMLDMRKISESKGNRPDVYMARKNREKGVYIAFAMVNNECTEFPIVFKIGQSQQIEKRMKALANQIGIKFEVPVYLKICTDFEFAFHELCSHFWIGNEFFAGYPSMFVFVEYIRDEARKIEKRSEQVFRRFIRVGCHFDFEAAFLWIINPKFPEPRAYTPPFGRAVRDGIDLRTIGIQNVVPDFEKRLDDLVEGGLLVKVVKPSEAV